MKAWHRAHVWTRWIPIWRRELYSALHSPTVYIFAFVFFVLSGIFFNHVFTVFTRASMGDDVARLTYEINTFNVTDFVAQNVFGILVNLMLFVIPLLTMRLVAEERRLGTYDLLMSYPFREWDVVVGKFLATVTLVGMMLVLTLLYPALIYWASRGGLEIPVVASAYLGIACVSTSFVAIGLCASCLTDNQLVAAVITFAVLLLAYLLGALAPSDNSWAARLFDELDVFNHSDQFLRGVVRLEDISYFAVVTLGALFIAEKALRLRRLAILR